MKVREFASNWRTGIQQINDNVLAYFANFRNGMEILKQVTRLVHKLLMIYCFYCYRSSSDSSGVGVIVDCGCGSIRFW